MGEFKPEMLHDPNSSLTLTKASTDIASNDQYSMQSIPRWIEQVLWERYHDISKLPEGLDGIYGAVQIGSKQHRRHGHKRNHYTNSLSLD